MPVAVKTGKESGEETFKQDAELRCGCLAEDNASIRASERASVYTANPGAFVLLCPPKIRWYP